MRYYTLPDDTAEGVVAADDGAAYDLGHEFTDFHDLARSAADHGATLDDVARPATDDADRLSRADLAAAGRPLRAGEVWAAGVTYKISEEAREEESTMPDMYQDVYDADRPEIFFKATPSRTVGPGEAVGIRADSEWDAPEPELGIVLHRGEVVGFTAGNDVSSRDIEGQNPLYLPQAKVYDRCCSLGPCVASPEAVGDPLDLDMSVAIERGGEAVFEDATSTGEMVRTVEELVSYLDRHNRLPEFAVLLTGTSLVPPDEFTLREGDEVTVEIEGIGELANPVTEV
jgi:2-dehydro-3-deoxy-D-arabinonate dehydratase